jgi:hypothetical protein
MSMTLRPGTRIFSAICTTEMIAVKAPDGEVDLTIGGAPASTIAGEREGQTQISDGHGSGTSIGKRYVDEAGTIELLCTKAGDGVPAIGGELLQLKESKPLPASD